MHPCWLKVIVRRLSRAPPGVIHHSHIHASVATSQWLSALLPAIPGCQTSAYGPTALHIPSFSEPCILRSTPFRVMPAAVSSRLPDRYRLLGKVLFASAAFQPSARRIGAPPPTNADPGTPSTKGFSNLLG
jgi:hypothetical protein